MTETATVTFEMGGKKIIATITKDTETSLGVQIEFQPVLGKDEEGLHIGLFSLFMEALNS